MSVLNTRVAKNWLKFDTFLDVLSYFAAGNLEYTKSSTEELSPQDVIEEEQTRIGLEWCFRTHFVQRACDFMLNKKSPLMQPGETRPDMGGSYSTPNFAPILKVITKMIT